MNIIEPEAWREEIRTIFRPAAKKYYAGELKRNEYKGISGKFGSYAQKGDDVKRSMIRLRMPAGHLTQPKLAFIASAIRKHNVDKIKFTTCQTIQLHNLGLEAVCDIMESALDVGIVTVGGGGDFPRNTTCSPLSGLDKDEYFDVLPYAEAAGLYAMNFINAEKLPRKYKIGFSSSPKNISHATMRDLGYVARPDGKFDVYSAGGIGPNPRIGVRVAEAVEPKDILLYVKAMWLLFRENGNYKLRARARSRYMQDTLGGPEGYRAAFAVKLAQVEAERAAGSTEFDFDVVIPEVKKTGNGTINNWRALPQKQEGLYSVIYHPIGGTPEPAVFLKLADAVAAMPGVELRMSPEETAYIVNLTAEEAQRVMDITAEDTARTSFEMASACIGASICQAGVRDSQALIHACVKAVAEAGIPDGALPPIHICGCPGSCSTPDLVPLGFRGGVREHQSAFILMINGCDIEGKERFAQIVDVLFEQDVPRFLVDLGKAVAASGLCYADWVKVNPEGVLKVAAPYLSAKKYVH